MKYSIAIAALVVSIAGVYMLSHRQGKTETREKVVAVEQSDAPEFLEQTERINRALALLAGEQAELRRRLDALGEDLATDAPMLADPTNLDSEHHENAVASPPLSVDEQAELAAVSLDNHVRSEPVDVQWARQAETSITQGASSVEGLSVRQVECRTSLCKLDIEFTNVDAREVGTRELAHAVPWETIAYYHASVADPTHMVMYVAREGMSLPTPEG